MKLSGKDCKQLHDALTDAFRDKSSLKQMLRFELEKNLDEITSEDNLNKIVRSSKVYSDTFLSTKYP